MPRVKVQSAMSLKAIDRIAQECRGEFFGTCAPCTVQYGFANRKHAYLFCKKMEQIGAYAMLYA